MFNFGISHRVKKEAGEFDNQMVIIMKANPEQKGTRKFEFSQLVYETLKFNTNSNEDTSIPPIITNTQVSFGENKSNIGKLKNYSLFVNNGNVELPKVNVGKTTQAFSDSKLYKKLAKLHDLDTSKDQVLEIVRSTEDGEIEEEFGIAIYNLVPREGNESNIEVTIAELEDVKLDDNSEVEVTLD